MSDQHDSISITVDIDPEREWITIKARSQVKGIEFFSQGPDCALDVAAIVSYFVDKIRKHP